MRLIKLFVGLFPVYIKIKLRKQLWLHNLYSKSLQRSGLFYGFPSPVKLQKLYVKNIALQTIELLEISANVKSKNTVSLVLFLSSDTQRDLKSMQHLARLRQINTVYVVGNNSFTSNLERAVASAGLNIDVTNIESVTEWETNSILIIRSGDFLHLNAISLFLHYLSKTESTESVLYCDCDSLNAKGQRYKAEFYPDWNPDLQLSSGYIKTGLFVSGQDLIQDFKKFITNIEVGGALPLWLASVYLKDNFCDVVHLPYVLIHKSDAYVTDWHKCIQILNNKDFVCSKGPEINVAKLHWNKSALPLVSLIIPTKNAKSLVKNCIESIVKRTTYPNYEILLVDNNSDDHEAIDYFNILNNQSNITVLSYPYPFNYSAINNFAVEHAKGEIIGLVNNDIEVITPEWLALMVGHTLRKDIGCVGAKLLYPDNRIQHAGVIMGYGGGAGHAHKYFPRYHSGYLNRLIATHNFSAVTAACLLVKKSDYLSVGGLNENDLTVAFNDVDFCLRILQLGRRNLYCAEAVLYHHESISRGLDDTYIKKERFEKELTYLQNEWKGYIAHDPAYNRNLTLNRENFSIKD